MNTLMLNGHSKNNAMLFVLTAENHAEYASRREWDMLNLDVPYDVNCDCGLIRFLLCHWETVVMLGSDIWFTNMDIDALSFAPAEAAMTMAPDPCTDFPANGDFTIFRRLPTLEPLLSRIEQLQTRETRFGYQDAVKAILDSGGMPGLHIAPPRTLQSYPTAKGCLPPVRDDVFWQKGDLCIHFVGGGNWKKCLDIVAFDKLKLICEP